MMQVDWNRRPLKEKGPTFRVINNSDLEVLFGKIVIYFYDKAGKQLEVVTSSGKKKPSLSCSGNIFAGPVKAKEKIFVNFSCSPKKRVPEGATTYEAEMQVVGFTSKEGKIADTFWRNDDLVPDKRPKGGVKGK